MYLSFLPHISLSDGDYEFYLRKEIYIMKKIIVSEKQKALLFKNGKYVKLLGAGKHTVFGNAEFEKFIYGGF